jgi:hypothetical protein
MRQERRHGHPGGGFNADEIALKAIRKTPWPPSSRSPYDMGKMTVALYKLMNGEKLTFDNEESGKRPVKLITPENVDTLLKLQTCAKVRLQNTPECFVTFTAPPERCCLGKSAICYFPPTTISSLPSSASS